MRSSRSAWFVAATVLSACSSITYEESSPLTTARPTSVRGVEIPDAPPLREPYTSYLRIVRSGDGNPHTVGYAVRYDAVPSGRSDVAREVPTGTIFLEDVSFRRVGFVTDNGRGYRYDGSEPVFVGQGALLDLLPHWFEGTGFQVQPMG